MPKDRQDETAGAASRWQQHSRTLAAERVELEAAGKNWSARHVADLLDLSELTVKRMARRGALPAVKVARAWQFPPAKVRAWYSGESVEFPRPAPPRPRKGPKPRR